MKLCLIHHKLGPGGGMEVYFGNLVQECLRQGHHVDVYVTEALAGFHLPVEVQVTVMPVSKWVPKFLRKFVFARRLKKHLSTQHYDLRISTTRSFSQDIVIPGGTHKAYMQERKFWRLKDLVETYFETKSYQTSQWIVAQSPHMKEELRALYNIPAEKIIVFYPPVNADALNYAPHAPHQPLRLLFISTSHKRKGGLLLLDALKQLPADAFELWVVGRPFPEAQALQQTVKEWGYTKNLTQLYHDADLLLLPSYFEPFGLVVVEALQSGLPVLVSRACGVTPLLKESEALILEKQNAADLAQLLLQAKAQTFTIEPDFIARHQLGLPEYVKRLLCLCSAQAHTETGPANSQ